MENITALQLTKELIQIPSVNPPGNEEVCAKFLANLLHDCGFDVQLHHFGEQRFNLIASIAGKNSELPIGFTGHIDTVPLGIKAWSVDPFEAVEKDGKVYGRGATDMKAGIAAFIVACTQLKSEINQGCGVQLIITGGEETGCDGAKALINHAREVFQPLKILLVGEPTLNYPFIGHKGALWLKAESFGKTAHGAMPEQGINAIYKASKAIQKIQNFDFETDEHPVMGKPTFNVGTMQAGINVNSVPDYAKFEIDIRSVPEMSHDCICTKLADYLTEDVSLSSIVDVPSLCSDVNDPVIQQVFQVIQPYFSQPIQAKAVPYFTDGSVLLPVIGHAPVLIIGPGNPKMAHQTDEYCDIDKIDQSVEIYKKIIMELLQS